MRTIIAIEEDNTSGQPEYTTVVEPGKSLWDMMELRKLYLCRCCCLVHGFRTAKESENLMRHEKKFYSFTLIEYRCC